MVLISTYQVVADIDVEIDQQAQRVRLLRRMDRTGAREPYLGHAGTQDEGALLVLDRIRDFALNSIWPLMDPAQDPVQDDLAKLLGPQLRSEIRRIMGEEYVSVLARTAGTRREMLVLWKDLDQVRSCRGLDHLRIPWSGPTQDNLFPLTTPKTNDAGLCPTASPDILGRLLQLTEDNADEAELLPALDQLVAWAAHPVTLHEARHLADRKQDGPSGPPCPGCSTSLTAAERSEVSAYLATLTHPSLATTARLQACQAFTQLPPESTHARALREILTQDLESMCTSALPDFIRRSRTAMARLLGRSASGQLPSDFPRRLPVALEPPVFERD